MARGALPFQHRPMFAFRILQALVNSFVTGKAKRLLLIHDHSLDIAGMGSMTGKAFIVFKRRVLIFAPLLFHEWFMASLTELVSFCLEESFIARAMAAMAGSAVPILNGIVNIALLIFTFLRQMACIADLIGPAEEHVCGV